MRLLQTILILIIFYSSFDLFSQEFEFKLYYKNPCKSKPELAHNYFLEKDGIQLHPNFDGIVNLKSKGKYNLIHEKETITITISKRENSHTIVLSNKHEFIVTHNKHGYEFRNCKGKLNGNITDFYQNGKIRMIGTFKNGLVIGYLTEFYPNGELREIRLFNKKGYLIEKIFDNK